MNVAVFSHYFSPEIGAPSARIYDMAQQWSSFGLKVQVVTCFPNHPTGKLYPGYQSSRYFFEMLEGIHVHRHWTYMTPNRGFIKKTLGHASYFPSALFLSNRRLTCPDVTVGTSPTFFAAMAAARCATQHKVPFIMEVRDLWPAAMVELGILKQRFLIWLLERWELVLYRRANRIVTVTEAFRRNLIKRGIPASKTEFIPNGADEDFWVPMEKPEDLSDKLGLTRKFVVLYIGAHGISQALGRILEAAKVLTKHPNIQFVFVGEGAEKEKLVQSAKASGLHNVQFMEPVEKSMVRTLYALADVCLVPLRDIPIFDTFIPSKMFEMMAMERPIVASVRGEAAEILNASNAAVVVRPEDSTAIAEAILQIQRRPDKCAEMGKSGRKFVIGNYSRRSLAQRYATIFSQAIAHNKN